MARLPSKKKPVHPVCVTMPPSSALQQGRLHNTVLRRVPGAMLDHYSSSCQLGREEHPFSPSGTGWEQ